MPPRASGYYRVVSRGKSEVRIQEESKQLDRFVARHAIAWDEDTDKQWQTVSGTLCFVDISGFTNLSERLAARGRVGAEELTEVLNRVFGSMLDLARQRDGALLKYGGDALLLLFSSEDHPAQGVSAAVEMRAALRSAVEIPTSVGHVALKMSIGIHSGEIYLFRAAGTHDELIIAGPAASTVTEMEGTAAAGEIVVSSSTKALLPTDSATVAKGEGWLLRWRKARPCSCRDGVHVTPSTRSCRFRGWAGCRWGRGESRSRRRTPAPPLKRCSVRKPRPGSCPAWHLMRRVAASDEAAVCMTGG